MPSGAVCHQISDGCLEKGKLGEQKHAQSPPTYLFEENSDVNMDNSQDWFNRVGTLEVPDAALDRKGGQESPVNSQQSQKILAADPFGDMSSQAFLEDASFGLDDTMAPMSALIGRSLGGINSSIDAEYEEFTKRFYCGYSSLTISEERELQCIVMPSYVLLDATTAAEEETSYTLKPEIQIPHKKQKSVISSEGGGANHLYKTKKQGHNLIEKRYRTNLNEKIAALLQCLPSMRTPLNFEQVNRNTKEYKGPAFNAAQTPRKAAILTGALEYINSLEGNIAQLDTETATLKTRITAFEKLVKSRSLVLSNSSSKSYTPFPRTCFYTLRRQAAKIKTISEPTAFETAPERKRKRTGKSDEQETLA